MKKLPMEVTFMKNAKFAFYFQRLFWYFKYLVLSLIYLKGVTGYVLLLNWVRSVVENLFRIHLRHITLFKDL